jgi:hypothetical protein
MSQGARGLACLALRAMGLPTTCHPGAAQSTCRRSSGAWCTHVTTTVARSAADEWWSSVTKIFTLRFEAMRRICLARCLWRWRTKRNWRRGGVAHRWPSGGVAAAADVGGVGQLRWPREQLCGTVVLQDQRKGDKKQ